MKKSQNPSAIRSRKLLTESLLKLMESKAFDAINITELTESCELTRKTFYRNFSSKEEILQDYIDTLFEEYLNALNDLPAFEPPKVVYIYFSICEKYKDFLLLLQKQNLLSILYLKYQEFLPMIASCFQAAQFKTTAPSHYHVAFSAGGFFQLLCTWLQNGGKETPEEMVRICMEFLT